MQPSRPCARPRTRSRVLTGVLVLATVASILVGCAEGRRTLPTVVSSTGRKTQIFSADGTLITEVIPDENREAVAELEVAIEGTSHRVSHPKAVVVDESAEGLNAIEVIDPEGRQHIVVLRRPLRLPPD